MSEAKFLFEVEQEVSDLPEGYFRYASEAWASFVLPKKLLPLIQKMCEGIEEPRITYEVRKIKAGQHFSHGRWHTDGKKEGDETHRLLTIGGKPTEGRGGKILHAGMVWEYDGAYLHRAVPTDKDCKRFLLRVSRTSMPYRNRWVR